MVGGLAFYTGVAIEKAGNSGDETASSGSLAAIDIGNPTAGRELFVSKGCAMCHSFEGQGGSDAPNLDYMKGELNPQEVAAMSGLIWNHEPMMEGAFKEEGIPFPTFKSGEMEDLIAYLHGGGPPPNMKDMPMMGSESAGGGKNSMGGGKNSMGNGNGMGNGG